MSVACVDSAFCYCWKCTECTEKFSCNDAFTLPRRSTYASEVLLCPTRRQDVLLVSVLIILNIHTRFELVNIGQREI